MIEKTDMVQGAADADSWAAGVDLGGIKVEVAQVDQSGRLLARLRRLTDVRDGTAAAKAEITAALRELIV